MNAGAAGLTPVVCGIDFSPESARAQRCAVAVARRLGRPLHLVSAIEPLLAEAARVQGRADDFLDHVRDELRAIAARGAAGLTTTIHVGTGDPASVLSDAADVVDAPVIVVGTRGLGRAARFFLGSTSTRLLRTTDRPVLAVPAPDDTAGDEGAEWPPVTRVICGLDFSEGSIAAARSAATFANGLGARLTLVHAVAPIPVPVVWEELVHDAGVDLVAQATDRMRALAASLHTDAEVRARLGTPADVLADEAGQEASAIIAVGLRGTSLHRPGSTALRVLMTARMPVLAVPA